jgi:hypothetical protein
LHSIFIKFCHLIMNFDHPHFEENSANIYRWRWKSCDMIRLTRLDILLVYIVMSILELKCDYSDNYDRNVNKNRSESWMKMKKRLKIIVRKLRETRKQNWEENRWIDIWSEEKRKEGKKDMIEIWRGWESENFW